MYTCDLFQLTGMPHFKIQKSKICKQIMPIFYKNIYLGKKNKTNLKSKNMMQMSEGHTFIKLNSIQWPPSFI